MINQYDQKFQYKNIANISENNNDEKKNSFNKNVPTSSNKKNIQRIEMKALSAC